MLARTLDARRRADIARQVADCPLDRPIVAMFEGNVGYGRCDHCSSFVVLFVVCVHVQASERRLQLHPSILPGGSVRRVNERLNHRSLLPIQTTRHVPTSPNNDDDR